MLEENTISPVNHEVRRQFLRRTPIKLKQFARLLNDMVEQIVDPLRVKALLSQVRKTREACLAQEFELTARLLNQLIKQLSLGSESLDSQRPLLKRLSQKLLSHAEKLELGVVPKKETITEEPPNNPLSQAPEDNEQQETTEAIEIYIDKGKIIFVSDAGSQHEQLCQQFETLGVESCILTDLDTAFVHAQQHPGSIVVASLSNAESTKVLADESVETPKIPLIYISDEDNQQNRAKAVRNGGTGFVIKPVSISTLYEQIERLYDLHADTPKRILVMEDSKAQARYYEKVLGKGHFNIRVVTNPEVFLEALRGFDPETVLMDMQMPSSSGIELTQIIRQITRYQHLPIIFLSAEENIRKQNQALMSGGTSFIVKPVQKEQLMFMANLYTQRFRNLNPHIGVNPDTGLPYNPQFKQMLTIETARMSRNPSSLALAIIHLDDCQSLESEALFSFINNTILQLAQLLKKRLRKTDIIGHIDGNTLGVILTSGKKKHWLDVMTKVQEQFSSLPFQLQSETKNMSVSVGMSELHHNYNAHQWLERSNEALAKALEKGSSSLEWLDFG